MIKIYYDGVATQITDQSSESNRFIKFTGKPNLISIIDFDFQPRNEGEEAKYIFSILPTTPFTPNHNLKIVFPDVYDKYLGRNLICNTLGVI